jgi:hypothetical protein
MNNCSITPYKCEIFMTIDVSKKQYKLFFTQTKESEMSTKPAAKTVAKTKPATTATAKATTPAVTKTPAKPVAKAPIAKPAVKKAPVVTSKKVSPAPAAKTATKTAVAADSKPKTPKVKMERDSFTMPKEEYAQIATLKKRLDGLGKPVKKSELLRAGLKLLSAMNDAALQTALAAVPTIKTGRPKK